MYLEIKDDEKNALKWLLLKGMEQTNSNRKFEMFERLSDEVRTSETASEVSPLLGMVSCFAVIDKNARGGESIDSIWLDEEKAEARKKEIRAYRIEKHEVNT